MGHNVELSGPPKAGPLERLGRRQGEPHTTDLDRARPSHFARSDSSEAATANVSGGTPCATDSAATTWQTLGKRSFH